MIWSLWRKTVKSVITTLKPRYRSRHYGDRYTWMEVDLTKNYFKSEKFIVIRQNGKHVVWAYRFYVQTGRALSTYCDSSFWVIYHRFEHSLTVLVDFVFDRVNRVPHSTLFRIEYVCSTLPKFLVTGGDTVVTYFSTVRGQIFGLFFAPKIRTLSEKRPTHFEN